MKSPRDSRHHKRCKSNGGTNEASNISMVTTAQHQAYHLLFRNNPPQVIASILTHKWIDSRYKLICILKEKGE